MARPGDEKTTEPGQQCWKGAIRGRITTLEEAYGEYRLKRHKQQVSIMRKTRPLSRFAIVVVAVLLATVLPAVATKGAIVRDPDVTWYLAEGTTAWGFSTYITIGNPNPESVTAKITYLNVAGGSGGGKLDGRDVSLAPQSQITVDPRVDVKDMDFSTIVKSSDGLPITVDRTMFWTGAGATVGEGHNAMAVDAPAKTWYLPEGSSAWGFETWTLVQNPSGAEADLTLTYMTPDAWQKIVKTKLPAYSRASYSMLADIGARDASVRVTSDVDVIAERSMYRNNRREGSCSMGATTASNDYFLAEGTTAWGFSTFVLIQNPNESAANVTITYMTPEGPVAQPPFALPPASRKTIKVNDVAGLSSTDLSTKVHADVPIVAERAMYWKGGPDGVEACHASIGVPGGSKSFLLPDGQTSGGRETYALVQNPTSSAIPVDVTYLPENGDDPVSRKATIPANSRRTFNMADEIADGRAAILVSVDGGVGDVIAERSMYWDKRGAGTDTVGSGGMGTRNWPKPPNGDPYYSTDYEMPLSRSPQDLARWLGSEHMEYDLDGWFFFGGLTDGATGQPGAFAIEVQRIRTPKGGINWEIVPAMVAYNAPSVGKYVYGYTGTLDMEPFVKVNTDPWLVEIYNPSIQTQPTITMGVASGTMGVPGVVYRLTWDTPDNEGKRFQGTVLVKDRLGTVNHGYGTTSFFTEFFTAAQQQEMAKSFNNSPGAYLNATGDPMTGQGDYYNSFPLMDVQSFSMTRDGVPFSSGNSGTLWTDYTVASYDTQAIENVITYPASWKFFSIMLPSENAAIMAIRIYSKTGVMQMAKLYRVGQETQRNGSHNAAYTWDSVSIEGIGDIWESPASHIKYDMQYRLRFGPNNQSTITMKMVRPDQEIYTPDDRYIYEGLGTVTGIVDGKKVEGTAFTELESVK